MAEARQGEILISEAAYAAADLEREVLEQRELTLRGKSEPTKVRVLRVAADRPAKPLP